MQVRERTVISNEHEKAVIVDSIKMENDTGGHNNVTAPKSKLPRRNRNLSLALSCIGMRHKKNES